MKKIFGLTLCLLGQNAFAQIRDFQTTRLMSTGGAGVASILSTEAGILNPATAAFFRDSSASYQRMQTNLNHKNQTRDTLPDPFAKDNHSQALFVSDHDGPVKGGVSYIDQKENNYQRHRMALHGAAPISDSTSMGLSYRYTQDKFPATSQHRHHSYHQAALGLAHIVDEETILGLVLVDPTRSNPGDERIITGFQYSLSQKIILIGDAGYQYSRAISKQYQWNAAVQINVFSDLFLRAGRFYDNVREFKGMGWGASWLGPRLGVELAQRVSESIGGNTYLYGGETIVDTSLSAIIKF